MFSERNLKIFKIAVDLLLSTRTDCIASLANLLELDPFVLSAEYKLWLWVNQKSYPFKPVAPTFSELFQLTKERCVDGQLMEDGSVILTCTNCSSVAREPVDKILQHLNMWRCPSCDSWHHVDVCELN